MSLTAAGWEMVVTLVDKGGNTTTRRFPFIDTDTAGDMSALVSQASDMLTDLAAVSLLVVKSYFLAKRFIEDALTLPSDAGAEVEAHALITAPIDGHSNKSASIDIPGPKPGIFVDTSGPGYNVVDTTDSDLNNYLNNFVVNGSGGLFYVSDGENIENANVKGKRTHSRSLKG